MREIREAWCGTSLHRVTHEVLIKIKERREIGLEERDAKHVRPGFGGKPKTHPSATQICTGLSTVDCRHLTTAAIGCRGSSASLPIQESNTLGIEEDFQLFTWNRTKARR